jgi:hypothetical protein
MSEYARSLMFEFKHAESLAWCDKALAIAERHDLIPEFTELLITKGVSLGVTYRIREGLTLLEKGLELAREHQLMKSKRRVLQNLAYLRGSDDWRSDDLELERLEDARRLGEPRQLAEVLTGRAFSFVWEFDWDGMDRMLAELDPEALSPEVSTEYYDAIQTRQAMTGDPQGAVRLMEARWLEREGIGDAQQAGNLEGSKAGAAMWLQNYEEMFERATKLELRTPYRLDIFWMMFAALQLRDLQRLERTRDEIDLCAFRGRVINLMGEATRGAIAVVEGRGDAAAEHWDTACELAEEVWPRGLAAMVWAEAGRYLGTDHPIGRERGRQAYVVMASAGVETVLDMFSEGLVAPGNEAARAETA